MTGIATTPIKVAMSCPMMLYAVFRATSDWRGVMALISARQFQVVAVPDGRHPALHEPQPTPLRWQIVEPIGRCDPPPEEGEVLPQLLKAVLLPMMTPGLLRQEVGDWHSGAIPAEEPQRLQEATTAPTQPVEVRGRQKQRPARPQNPAQLAPHGLRVDGEMLQNLQEDNAIHRGIRERQARERLDRVDRETGSRASGEARVTRVGRHVHCTHRVPQPA